MRTSVRAGREQSRQGGEDRAFSVFSVMRQDFKLENRSDLRHLPPPATAYGNWGVQSQNYTVDTPPGKMKERDEADPH